MEAIRKTRVKNINHKIVVDLPESFNAKEVDVIILPSEMDSEKLSESDIENWRKELIEFYSTFKVDTSNFKFNRDELYDRP